HRGLREARGPGARRGDQTPENCAWCYTLTPGPRCCSACARRGILPHLDKRENSCPHQSHEQTLQLKFVVLRQDGMDTAATAVSHHQIRGNASTALAPERINSQLQVRPTWR